MTCGKEAGVLRSIVEQSELEESRKDEVAQVLQQAQDQEQQGNTATCVQIVERIKVALGLQPQAGNAPSVPQ